jgi:hypothetical protein
MQGVMTRELPPWTCLTLVLVTLLGACSVLRVPLPWNGDATAISREMLPQKLAREVARELGVDIHSGGGGRGGGGGDIFWSFSIGFDGDEADRAEFMLALEQRMDAALEDEGIEVSGKGAWNGLPGFRRSYRNSRQRGSLSVYSAVKSDGTVFICGEGQEFPK